jgi:hypothetical protein
MPHEVEKSALVGPPQEEEGEDDSVRDKDRLVDPVLRHEDAILQNKKRLSKSVQTKKVAL